MKSVTDRGEIARRRYAGRTIRNHYPQCAITPRSAEVLYLLIQGKTDNEIAKVLGIAAQTVKRHITDCARRFNIRFSRPRIQLAIYWSWPIFRIGAGYESPKPSLPGADLIAHYRLRSQEGSRSNAAD